MNYEQFMESVQFQGMFLSANSRLHVILSNIQKQQDKSTRY